MMAETTVKELQKAVDKGAKWLDENYPTWWRKINGDNLDLSSVSYCVLGQTFKSYTTNEMWIDNGYDYAVDKLLPVEDAAEYGFSRPIDSETVAVSADLGRLAVGLDVQVDTWNVLDVMWLSKIEERKAIAREERAAKRKAKVAI